MAISMDQMQQMMASMHQKNYISDMRLAQHFQDISNTFLSMAQGEYQMYQMHTGQTSGMAQQTSGQMTGPMVQSMPGIGPVTGTAR